MNIFQKVKCKAYMAKAHDAVMVTKEDVLRWLRSEVRVDGDM